MSEFHAQLGVDESACQVVGYGVLLVADVSHPVVGVDVVDAEEVEAIDAQPYTFQSEGCAFFVLVCQIAQSDVGSTIGRSTELLVFQSSVGRSEG